MTILQNGICGQYELFSIDKGTEKLESRGICGIIMLRARLIGSYSWDCREEWRKIRTVGDLETWIDDNQCNKTNWKSIA